MNTITLTATIVSKPQMKETMSGEQFCIFHAKSRRRTSSQEDTFSIAVWGNQAQNCVDRYEIGQEVFIAGEVRINVYKARKSNCIGLSVQVAADYITELADNSKKTKENPAYDSWEFN